MLGAAAVSWVADAHLPAGDKHMKYCRMAIAVLLTIAAVAARAEERLPTIPPAQYTEEQKQAAADFEAARKVPVFGPFEPLMYSPQVMSQARAMSPDEETVFDFTSELLRNKRVSDATFERAKSRLGPKGIVDMTGIVGYYTFLAMQLNVAQYQVATDGKKLPRMPR